MHANCVIVRKSAGRAWHFVYHIDKYSTANVILLYQANRIVIQQVYARGCWCAVYYLILRAIVDCNVDVVIFVGDVKFRGSCKLLW